MGWLNCYYNVILAWDIYYIGLSFSHVLPWSHCNNDFNTPNCLNPEWTYGNNNATSPEACAGFDSFTKSAVKQVCLNGTLRNLSDFTPAVEEFWEWVYTLKKWRAICLMVLRCLVGITLATLNPKKGSRNSKTPLLIEPLNVHVENLRRFSLHSTGQRYIIV